MRTALPVLALLLGLAPLLAGAHQVGLSRSNWTVEPGGVRATVALAQSELNAIDPKALERVVVEGVAVEGCALASSSAQAVEQDGVEVALAFGCGGEGERRADLTKLLARLGSAHRHLAQVGSRERMLESGAGRFSLTAVEPERSFGGFVVLGLFHILEGPDHLLFLLGLLLGVRRLCGVVGVATAFTLGHSVTLSVATLGLWVPPARVVEPLIALSLVWVGVENVLRGEARGRWRVAGAFGLVHGFGFASMLRSLSLPPEQLGWALFGFNLGVEIGQLLVLAPLVPLLALLRKREGLERKVAKALSAGVALAGAGWFFARVAAG